MRRKTPRAPLGSLVAALSGHRRDLAWRASNNRHAAVVARALNVPVLLDPDPDYPDGYVLIESGAVVSRWRERDAPGLAAWLATRMHERHSALILARSEVARLQQSAVRGKQGAARRDPEAKYPKLARQIRSCVERGEPTTSFVRHWLTDHPIARSTLYDLIKRIKKNATTK